MSAVATNPLVERQLLLQLGDRLRRLRIDQGLSAVEMAARVGLTRNTLRAIESGDPGPALGNYLRVMSELGVAGDLALLAADSLQAAPAGSAAARSRRSRPQVQVLVAADASQHQAQDLQSLALHEEAVRLLREQPALVGTAQATLQHWLDAGQSRAAPLWREWQALLAGRQWRRILARTQRAQELRQASPLVTLLPDETRQRVLRQIAELRKGVMLGARAQEP